MAREPVKLRGAKARVLENSLLELGEVTQFFDAAFKRAQERGADSIDLLTTMAIAQKMIMQTQKQLEEIIGE